MKQLINGYDNSEIVNQPDYRKFFLKVKTSDITDNELRIAVQSYKLSVHIIDSHYKKLMSDMKKDN